MSHWLRRAVVQYGLKTTHVHPERFPMNGKALLFMSREMFLWRVPEGGGLLFEDIQLRLQKLLPAAAAAVQDSNSARVLLGGGGDTLDQVTRMIFS